MNPRYICAYETFMDFDHGGPTLGPHQVLVIDTRPQDGPPVILARSTAQAGEALAEILNAKEEKTDGEHQR